MVHSKKCKEILQILPKLQKNVQIANEKKLFFARRPPIKRCTPSIAFLPHPLFMFCVVNEGAVVAMQSTDILNKLLVLGGNRLHAVAQPVVHLAVVVANEVGTDGALLLASHLLKKLGQARLHHQCLVFAIYGTLRGCHLRKLRIDSLHEIIPCVDILATGIAQTAIMQWALVAEAHQIVWVASLIGFLQRGREPYRLPPAWRAI